MAGSLSFYSDYTVNEGPVRLYKIHALHGANYFSADRVVYMRINLGLFDEVFTNDIEGFYDRLTTLLPSLQQHFCSPGVPGGFFMRVQEGTLLGHVIEHVSIELQTLAGMDVGYGKTRSTPEKGTYNVVFRFFDEVAGLYAGKAAINLVNALVENKPFDVSPVLAALIDIREQQLLGPSTQAIVDEALKRHIPFQRLDNYNLVQLGTGKYHKRIRATLTSDTGFIAVETAENKHLSMMMLSDAGLPVPETKRVLSASNAVRFWTVLQAPIVLKPAGGNRGRFIFKELNTEDSINEAFKLAMLSGDDILAQQYLKGASYRLLVINYRFVAASLLTPPFITGNGTATVTELIANLNAEPGRDEGDKGKLSTVEVDETTLNILKQNKLTLLSVLPFGSRLYLKHTGNMREGGSATDVTAIVNADNIFMAERAARIIGLNVAGVDVLSNDISKPMTENGGVIIEVNAAPDFRMHLNPTFNKPQPVARHFLNMLFPLNTTTRIPLFSVTGTAGKTITCFLLNYCLRNTNHKAGLTSTEGLYITDRRLIKGDMTDPESVSLVLKDPTIDCAVLETSLEGILRSGLGYRYADFGIVLNVLEDHIGSDDTEFIEDLAYAKAVVAEEVYASGFTILNAANPHTLAMLDRLYSKPILFCNELPHPPSLLKHIASGGAAVTLEGDDIKIYDKNQQFVIMQVKDVPLFFGGKALFMSDAVLAAIAALNAFGMTPELIKSNIGSFKPVFENLPGRLNLYEKEQFTLLIDYAHNPASFKALGGFIAHFDAPKTGILDTPGDRSDEQIRELGRIAAGMFNNVVVYEGVDNRGRESGAITKLLCEGFSESGFNMQNIKTAASHAEALALIPPMCNSGNFITLITACCDEAVAYLKKEGVI